MQLKEAFPFKFPNAGKAAGEYILGSKDGNKSKSSTLIITVIKV